MYLLARNTEKNEFIVAIGFLFLVGSFPLIAGLTMSGVITFDVLLLSGLCTVVSLVGFQIGKKIRRRLSEERFQRVVLGFFLIMGLRLVFVGLWPG